MATDALQMLYGEQNQQLTEERVRDGYTLSEMFSTQLDKYYALPSSSFHDDNISRKFYKQRLKHIGFKPYPKDGCITFGASSTALCDRQIVFKNGKIRAEKTDDIPFRSRQRRVGSSVIEYVQLDLVHMEKRLGDDAVFTIAVTKTGEYAFEDAAQHRKVFDHNGVKFAITAKPDGVLAYKHDTDRRFIFEYKTKASGVVEMNSKLDFSGIQKDHLRQVTAEALVFGIDEGFVVYESMHKPSWFSDEERKSVPKTRKTWRDGAPVKDLRVMYFKITEDMKRELLDDLAAQATLVYNGEIPEITVDMTSKCGFCQFKTHCKSILSQEEKAMLLEVEAQMSSTDLSGKTSHVNLLNYLSD